MTLTEAYLLGRRDERTRPSALCSNPPNICTRCIKRPDCFDAVCGAYISVCDEFQIDEECKRHKHESTEEYLLRVWSKEMQQKIDKQIAKSVYNWAIQQKEPGELEKAKMLCESFDHAIDVYKFINKHEPLRVVSITENNTDKDRFSLYYYPEQNKK